MRIVNWDMRAETSRELESRVETAFSFQESGLNSYTLVTIDNWSVTLTSVHRPQSVHYTIYTVLVLINIYN